MRQDVVHRIAAPCSDSGLTCPIHDALQRDLPVALGLNRNTPDLQWAVGATYRL